MEPWILIAGLATAAGLFVFALAKAWQKVARKAGSPPLLDLLAACEAGREPSSAEAMAVALRRCTFCSAGEQCQRKLAAGQPIPDYCPNAGFLASLGKLRPT
jgi:hypothetical protein